MSASDQCVLNMDKWSENTDERSKYFPILMGTTGNIFLIFICNLASYTNRQKLDFAYIIIYNNSK